MSYVFAGLVVAGIILYIALCIASLVGGGDNDHPLIGSTPSMLLMLLWLFGLFMPIAQAFAEAGAGARACSSSIAMVSSRSFPGVRWLCLALRVRS